MSFWNIATIVIAILLLSLAIIAFDLWWRNRMKNELMLAAEEFGTNVFAECGYSSPYTVRFERDGTVFDGAIHIRSKSSDFIVSFDLPPIQEKFFIRHNSFWSAGNILGEGSHSPSSDYQPVSHSALSKDYLLHSLNPDFLLTLLSKEKVIPEIIQYESDWGRFVEIAFETGHFEVKLHTDGTSAAEKYRQICETAIVFYDCIKPLTIKTS
jgi:hypothetical protein